MIRASHAIHEAAAVVYVTDRGEVFVRASETVTVRHEEHSPITLDSGTYRIGRQVEYSPEALRNVAD